MLTITMDPKPQPQKQANWCFTINNPTDEPTLTSEMRYLCFGREKGAEGTPHLQGFVVFRKNLRLSAVSKIFPRAHLEPAKGSTEQNVTYCSKDGDFVEFGDKPQSKRKSGEIEAQRWKDALTSCKAGKLDDVPEDIRFRFYRTCKEIAKDYMIMPPVVDKLTNFWYHGASGTGKSRFARQEYPRAYLKMANKWWDGYQNEDHVIIEDLDRNHSVLCHHLKLWGDHYPFLAEIKGGAVAIRPKVIIITSNYTPEEIWRDQPADLEAIQRRYEEVKF